MALSRFCAAVAAAMTLLGASAGAKACVLRVGWEPYGVYTFRDADGQATGIDIEMMRTVAKEVGCRTHFTERPWARILLEIEQGELEVTTSASRNREREAFAHFSRPYREAEVALFVRRGLGLLAAA